MTTSISLPDANSEDLRLLIKSVLLDIVRTDREFVRQLVEELQEELAQPEPPIAGDFDAFSIVGLFAAEPDFAERSEEMLHARFAAEDAHDA
ncbi:MAG: hypothetical protein ACFB9N_06955 [Geitlerinemataceae cyanobacterium]